MYLLKKRLSCDFPAIAMLSLLEGYINFEGETAPAISSPPWGPRQQQADWRIKQRSLAAKKCKVL